MPRSTRRPSPVVFWWRDDDAGRDHQRLAALLELADAFGAAPVALAVVPGWLTDACARTHPGCGAWRPSSSTGSPMPTMPCRRPRRSSLAALPIAASFGRRLAGRAGARSRRLLRRPVRAGAGAALEPHRARPCRQLTSLGFDGALHLSGRGARRWPVPGLRQVNTHLDLVAWREQAPGPSSCAELLAQLARLVEAVSASRSAS